MSIAHKVNGSWQKTAGLPPVDSALSSTSQNPLENRQIYAALADKITASVSNLVNYYKKSETYTQAEVRQLIGAISTLSIKVVAALPTSDISATTIYWVGPDVTTGKYDQYIYSNNTWVKTGDTSVNLGDYVTTEALELAIADFLTEDDVRTILASYYTKTEIDTLLNGKQDSLTFDNAPTENSANVVKSGGVYSAVDDVYKVIGENGAKNLIPYPHSGKTETKAGITFTENADGSVTVNGTATEISRHLISSQQFEVGKKYILSGCPNGGGHGSNGTYTLYTQSINNYDDGESVEFEWNASITGITIAVFAGVTVNNLTFYPMLRLASDTDSTYQPYALTNQELTNAKYLASSANTILGAKNFFVYPYRETTKTTNGITFTDLGDGRIQCDGTATAMTTFALCSRTVGLIPETYLPNGEYILSSGTEGGDGSTTYEIQLGIQKDGAYQQVAWTRNGGQQKFTIDGDDNNTDKAKMDSAIVIRSGVTVSNLIFKPLIRLVGDGDDAWAPYAKTNQQLTEDKAEQAEVNDIVNVYGAKNLLQYPYYSTTTTVSGVTITDNGDGTLTLDGTATARISYNITATASYNLLEVGKKYLINFKTSNDTIDSSSWALRIYCKKDNTTVLSTTDSRGPDVAFTVPEETVGANVQFIIVNGTVLDSVVIKPMIRLASITDDTYVPYAKTNQQLTEDKAEKSQVSNPNLLDNPWFTINQRGITDSWNTQFSVGVDRWAKSSDSSSTLEVTTDGIAEVDDKAFSIYQVLDSAATNYESIKRLYGKTLTISVLFSDGTIETGSYNLPLSDYRPSTNQTRTFINNSTRIEYARIESFAVGNVNLAIRVKAGNVIRAVKLEIGTASTLINDTAPNYQQELAKCQRYFVRFKSNATYSVYSDMGYVVSATEVRTPMNLPVSMRQSPTVTTSGSLRIFNATDYSTMSQSITSVSGMGFLGSKLMLKCVGTGFISGKMAMLAADNDADTYIDFSADL